MVIEHGMDVREEFRFVAFIRRHSAVGYLGNGQVSLLLREEERFQGCGGILAEVQKQQEPQTRGRNEHRVFCAVSTSSGR